MLIVKLMGGLGNQMFQYAFGRCISHRNNEILKLDVSFYKDHQNRNYELNKLTILEHIASIPECVKLTSRDTTRLNKFKQQYLESPKTLVKEKTLAFDEKYLAIRHSAYLDGYWQSEKYFIEIESLIKKEFKVTAEASPSNQECLNQIQSVNAVSLHVRRGDYEHNKTVNQIHGICTLDYYRAATKLIASKISRPVFFVFSDDIAWAEKHIDFDGDFRFVSINNTETAYEDLRLMYSCNHNIIANSTFSWWGAWLNPNGDKIVVAPKKWFNIPDLNHLSKTIVPESWIRL